MADLMSWIFPEAPKEEVRHKNNISDLWKFPLSNEAVAVIVWCVAITASIFVGYLHCLSNDENPNRQKPPVRRKKSKLPVSSHSVPTSEGTGQKHRNSIDLQLKPATRTWEGQSGKKAEPIPFQFEPPSEDFVSQVPQPGDKTGSKVRVVEDKPLESNFARDDNDNSSVSGVHSYVMDKRNRSNGKKHWAKARLDTSALKRDGTKSNSKAHWHETEINNGKFCDKPRSPPSQESPRSSVSEASSGSGRLSVRDLTKSGQSKSTGRSSRDSTPSGRGRSSQDLTPSGQGGPKRKTSRDLASKVKDKSRRQTSQGRTSQRISSKSNTLPEKRKHSSQSTSHLGVSKESQPSHAQSHVKGNGKKHSSRMTKDGTTKLTDSARLSKLNIADKYKKNARGFDRAVQAAIGKAESEIRKVSMSDIPGAVTGKLISGAMKGIQAAATAKRESGDSAQMKSVGFMGQERKRSSSSSGVKRTTNPDNKGAECTLKDGKMIGVVEAPTEKSEEDDNEEPDDKEEPDKNEDGDNKTPSNNDFKKALNTREDASPAEQASGVSQKLKNFKDYIMNYLPIGGAKSGDCGYGEEEVSTASSSCDECRAKSCCIPNINFKECGRRSCSPRFTPCKPSCGETWCTKSCRGPRRSSLTEDCDDIQTYSRPTCRRRQCRSLPRTNRKPRRSCYGSSYQIPLGTYTQSTYGTYMPPSYIYGTCATTPWRAQCWSQNAHSSIISKSASPYPKNNVMNTVSKAGQSSNNMVARPSRTKGPRIMLSSFPTSCKSIVNFPMPKPSTHTCHQIAESIDVKNCQTPSPPAKRYRGSDDISRQEYNLESHNSYDGLRTPMHLKKKRNVSPILCNNSWLPIYENIRTVDQVINNIVDRQENFGEWLNCSKYDSDKCMSSTIYDSEGRRSESGPLYGHVDHRHMDRKHSSIYGLGNLSSGAPWIEIDSTKESPVVCDKPHARTTEESWSPRIKPRCTERITSCGKCKSHPFKYAKSLLSIRAEVKKYEDAVESDSCTTFPANHTNAPIASPAQTARLPVKDLTPPTVSLESRQLVYLYKLDLKKVGVGFRLSPVAVDEDESLEESPKPRTVVLHVSDSCPARFEKPSKTGCDFYIPPEVSVKKVMNKSGFQDKETLLKAFEAPRRCRTTKERRSHSAPGYKQSPSAQSFEKFCKESLIVCSTPLGLAAQQIKASNSGKDISSAELKQRARMKTKSPNRLGGQTITKTAKTNTRTHGENMVSNATVGKWRMPQRQGSNSESNLTTKKVANRKARENTAYIDKSCNSLFPFKSHEKKLKSPSLNTKQERNEGNESLNFEKRLSDIELAKVKASKDARKNQSTLGGKPLGPHVKVYLDKVDRCIPSYSNLTNVAKPSGKKGFLKEGFKSNKKLSCATSKTQPSPTPSDYLRDRNEKWLSHGCKTVMHPKNKGGDHTQRKQRKLQHENSSRKQVHPLKSRKQVAHYTKSVGPPLLRTAARAAAKRCIYNSDTSHNRIIEYSCDSEVGKTRIDTPYTPNMVRCPGRLAKKRKLANKRPRQDLGAVKRTLLSPGQAHRYTNTGSLSNTSPADSPVYYKPTRESPARVGKSLDSLIKHSTPGSEKSLIMDFIQLIQSCHSKGENENKNDGMEEVVTPSLCCQTSSLSIDTSWDVSAAQIFD